MDRCKLCFSFSASHVKLFYFSFSFDYFSNGSSIDSSALAQSHNGSLSSAASQKTTVSRSHSDSSTISCKSNEAAEKVNRSVDTAPSSKQLLKLSFFNSPNSPMNCFSFNNTPLAESMSQEAKKIAKRFTDSGDSSFEDINDISQVELSDSSMDEFQEMNVHTFEKKPNPALPPSAEKIAIFQERLNSMKQEVDLDKPIKLEKLSPSAHDGNGDAGNEVSELDAILQSIKSVYNNGNKDEAKKQMQRLQELLGKQSASSEPKSTLHVQPIVRQDTFDIDPATGKRKYNSTENENNKTECQNDVMEKLAQILGAQSLDVHSIEFGLSNSSGTKLVVVVPNPVSTPVKKPLRKGLVQKPVSAMKARENKKQSTPMKQALTSVSKRFSSFTTPRPVPSSKATNPLSMQSRAGAVRKSLLNSMEQSPQGQKPRASMTPVKAPTRASNAVPRRSVSMKAAIPAVQVTKSTPAKTAAPRPSTGAPYAPTANRRLSHAPSPFVRPSSTAARIAPTRKIDPKSGLQFKTPGLIRKIVSDKESLV